MNEVLSTAFILPTVKYESHNWNLVTSMVSFWENFLSNFESGFLSQVPQPTLSRISRYFLWLPHNLYSFQWWLAQGCFPWGSISINNHGYTVQNSATKITLHFCRKFASHGDTVYICIRPEIKLQIIYLNLKYKLFQEFHTVADNFHHPYPFINASYIKAYMPLYYIQSRKRSTCFA